MSGETEGKGHGRHTKAKAEGKDVQCAIMTSLCCRQGPEKRKWAQVSPRRAAATTTPSGSESVRIKSRSRSAVLFQQQQQHPSIPVQSSSERSSSSAAAVDCCSNNSSLNNYSASSDDEVQALVGGNLSQVRSFVRTNVPHRLKISLCFYDGEIRHF